MHHLNTLDLWDTNDHGVEIFDPTMSRKGFLFLLKYLRFDDRHTRLKRNALGRLAAIRDILDTFVDNCKTHYLSPGSNVTIEEKVEGFSTCYSTVCSLISTNKEDIVNICCWVILRRSLLKVNHVKTKKLEVANKF